MGAQLGGRLYYTPEKKILADWYGKEISKHMLLKRAIKEMKRFRANGYSFSGSVGVNYYRKSGKINV